MTPIFVKTLLRGASGFVDAADPEARVTDPDYIDGAIELSVGDVQLLSVEQWDLVDQLWSYLVRGLGQALAGQPFHSYFPDQPLPIAMHVDGPTLVLGVGERSVASELCALGPALLLGARSFFETLALKDKRCRRSAKHELAQVAAVHEALREKLAAG